MKKNYFYTYKSTIAAIALSLLFCGCAKEVEQLQPQEELHEVVFHAGWAPETKTILQDDGSVWWSPGDEISLFVGKGNDGGYKLTSTNDEPSATTDFVGNISKKSSTETYTAIYPYNEVNNVEENTIYTVIPAIQTAKESTFEQKTFVSIARSDNENLYFRNICSGIKFSVKNAGIKKVVISTRDGASIAGGVSYSIDSWNCQFDSDASSKITVNAPSEAGFEIGKFYYAVLFPFKNDSGVDITFCTEDETAVFEYQMPIEFKRGVFKRLYEKDADLQFHGSKAIFKTNIILPDGVDKEQITQALFLTGNDTKTETIIPCSVEEGYEPIYFELDGTIAKYYTNASDIEIRTAREMFEDWMKLRELDLTSFETSQCERMDGMFYGCTSLTFLDISSFDMMKVKFMNMMFYGCSKLSQLYLGQFENKCADSYNGLFDGCESLNTVDISALESPYVDNMNFMFYGCSSLVSVKMPGIYDYCNGLQGVFSGCKSLEDIEWGHVSTIGVTTMNSMFFNCTSIKELNLGDFNFSNVEDMEGMFSVCKSLQKIKWPNTSTHKLKKVVSLFSGCSNLTDLNLSIFDMSNVTDMSYMFSGCGVKKYDFLGFDTSNVTNMFGMFEGCHAETLDLSTFNTSNVENMSYMFHASNIKEINLTSFNTAKVTNMFSMFNQCKHLETLDISSFHTPCVQNMDNMFSGCNELKNINFSNFSATSLQSMQEMFYMDCNILTIDLGGAEVPNSISVERCCTGMSKFSGNCAIKASDSLKSLMSVSGAGLNSSVIWVDLEESIPKIMPVIDPSLYYSTDFSMHGKIEQLQKATDGNGIDIVIMGDAYSNRLIENGTYLKDANRVIDAIFDIEPFSSYKNLFNIYLVYLVSVNEMSGKNTVLLSQCSTYGTLITGDDVLVYNYGRQASDKEPHKFTPIVFVNQDSHNGTASMVLSNDDSRGIMYIAMDSQDTEFIRTTQHEFGHVFGYLADEYSTHEGIIESDIKENTIFLTKLDSTIYRNIDFSNNLSEIKWKSFLYDKRYEKEGLGMYEGGFLYDRGVWRPSENSVMNAGSLFNAPSREAIYYRIHKLAYGDDWQYDYETFVQQDLKNIQAETKATTQSVPYPARVNDRKPFFKMEKIRDNDGGEMIRMIMN